MNILVLVNPTAGGGRTMKLLPSVKLWLAETPHSFEFKISGSREDIIRTTEDAVEKNYDAILAFGGDGTFHDIVSFAKEDGPAFGLIPGGRGNDFVRNLNYPKELKNICQGFGNPVFRKIDLPSVNGIPFLSIAGAGIDGEISREVRDGKCRMGGTICYIWYLLKTLVSYKAMQLEIELDGKRINEFAILAAVANGSYFGGGMQLVPEAKMDDGWLDLIILRNMSKLKIMRKFPMIYSGSHIPDVDIVLHRAKKISIKSDREAELYADGEPLTNLPATFEIGQIQLRVIVPG
ncbi:MAG: diacylglycerol kinase family lipid kinase [Candidatus Electryonea clarkiae]|nr:diacylglycerol kinase family lipid kinase [Candidatus Electryonea clarkiae]MDP8286319.1 diacylglycerol kinase family lipid kinase [Candidatus Electryonea clarkiae]